MHHISAASFFFIDTAPTEIYTLSLHDALPISRLSPGPPWDAVRSRSPSAAVGGGARRPPSSRRWAGSTSKKSRRGEPRRPVPAENALRVPRRAEGRQNWAVGTGIGGGSQDGENTRLETPHATSNVRRLDVQTSRLEQRKRVTVD